MTDFQSREEMENRKQVYIRRITVINLAFLFISVFASVLTQLFFHFYIPYLAWPISVAVLVLLYVLSSYIAYQLTKRFREISEKFLRFLLLRYKLLVFPLVILFTIGFPYLDVNIRATYFEITLLLLVNIFLMVRIIYPLLRERRIVSGKSKLKPLDTELENEFQKIVSNSLSEKIRIRVLERKNIKTANAYSVGIMSPTILVTDYLVENLSKDEFMAIMAHELGHYHFHDLRNNLITSSAALFGYLDALILAFYVNSGLSLLVFFSGLAVIFVFYSILSPKKRRSTEIRADRFAALYLKLRDQLISALIKLNDLNSVPLNFPRTGGATHPSVAMRINLLESMKLSTENNATSS